MRALLVICIVFVLVGTGLGGIQTLQTIISMITPHGSFTFEVLDPDVSLTIDGRAVSGPQQFRLRTGVHTFAATKDGQTVMEGAINVKQNGNAPLRMGWFSGALRTETIASDWIVETAAKGPGGEN